MINPPRELGKFASLVEIIEALRSPGGCPWDKEQTHKSLVPYAIEEVYELAEAIESGDDEEIVKELGDNLLQVVLHAEIGRGENRFDISDVIRGISEKMVRRHPHVFGDVKVESSQDVLKNWSEIKAAEKLAAAQGEIAVPETRFDIPLQLPALQRSQKIGDKTKRLRFDWSNATDVLMKVDEELAEVRAEMNDPAKRSALESEVGDLLFSVAQLARHLGFDAEQTLRNANTRFETRFFTMRNSVKESGRDYDKLTSEELEEAWRQVKLKLKGREN